MSTINPAKTIRDCHVGWQLAALNTLAPMPLPRIISLAWETHAFGKQVEWVGVNTGLILHPLGTSAVDRVMVCGF